MITRALGALVSLALISGCASSENAASATPSAPPTVSASSTPAVSPSSSGATLYTFEPEHGSNVHGTVQVANAADASTLTAKIAGLQAGGSYLADGDPLPCLLFVDGPSQSFAHPFSADSSGSATVTWTVPKGMAGNANIQALQQGQYVVQACADLS